MLADFEREFIRQRTAAGRERTEARGIRFGGKLAAVPGSSIPFVPTADTAGGASPGSTPLANCSRAGAVVTWLT